MFHLARHILRNEAVLIQFRPQYLAARKYHKNYDPAREEQSFTLPDGRTMGFAEHGNVEGTPLIFLHGAPGSRYDGLGFVEVAKKFDLRVITPDRPGHGLSTIQHLKSLSQYSLDISQLAKHLRISRYHVVGLSGGGPYAVACAYGLPKDELLSASVIAGMAPPTISNTIRHGGWYTVAVLAAIKWMPYLSSLALARASQVFKDEQKAQKTISKLLNRMNGEDKAMFTPETLSGLTASFKQAYIQGPAGVIRDAQIYGSPWDFELKDVRREVKLFYGNKDQRTPVAFGRYYKDQLPYAKLFEFDASHVTIEKYDDDIFAEILGVPKPEDASNVKEKI